MSASSLEVVSTTTGSDSVLASARMRRRTSSPLILGRLISSSTSEGWSSDAESSGRRSWSACSPSTATMSSLLKLFCSNARNVNSTSSGLSSTSRIGLLFMTVTPIRALRGEGEEERAAFPCLGFGPDPAAVAAQDAVHDRQADAAALEFGRRMQPLERVEQLCRVLHVEPGAVVTHEEDLAAGLPDRSHRDGG